MWCENLNWCVTQARPQSLSSSCPWERSCVTSLILKHMQQGKFTCAIFILIGLILQTEPRSPVRNPLSPDNYPLTRAVPNIGYINIISSVNKRSTLELISSTLKTSNFKHVKRTSLLSGFDAWTLCQKKETKIPHPQARNLFNQQELKISTILIVDEGAPVTTITHTNRERMKLKSSSHSENAKKRSPPG